MQTLKTGTVHANGLRFHFLEQGEGPLALCMHGFPDSAWTYRYLLPALATAGYRAVAPFIRGYAPTDVPADNCYDTNALRIDVNALHAALGGGSDAVLIAHDWSAVAAYGALAAEPQRWRRAVIGNVPPLNIFGQVAFRYEQIKRSFYFWFFQMAISDHIVPANDLAFIDGLWGDWSPGYDATYDLGKLKECLRNPANLKAAMGYYRALFNPARFGLPEGMAEQAAIWGQPVSQSVLYIHGTTDGCIALDTDTMQQVRHYLGPGSELERVEGVGHFFLVEKPTVINARILRFLTK
ncbi:MAG: alpha/beta hydrolase [Deltaproteobacteria bacterium]|nr:alpha/beta hydrolase [Deltaproteobacteria bacterium]